MSWSRLRKMVKDREAWYAAVHGVAKPPDTTEQLNNCPLGTTQLILSMGLVPVKGLGPQAAPKHQRLLP